ncbi:Transcriptional regulator MraZ [Commensalibacter sp. Nvir]|uniref:division/cell wall cluster transcriptional repressor MraZ n=1 Tax=Commensalibacter sp. Nvir TaxID=3069817 RepID=UPI002D3B3B08|nr:Transcriptional regulator MraZ [Commensalibacter sp. Nvir]
MNLFLGTHHNRLDIKGRVSIPASFRTCLKQQEKHNSLIFRPSHKMPCIEAWPFVVFMQLTLSLNNLDPLSDEHEDMATALYAEAWPIDLDKEGRIILPDFLKTHAHLTNSVTFLGLGTIFQIWEPKTALQRCSYAREKIKKNAVPLSPLVIRETFHE